MVVGGVSTQSTGGAPYNGSVEYQHLDSIFTNVKTALSGYNPHTPGADATASLYAAVLQAIKDLNEAPSTYLYIRTNGKAMDQITQALSCLEQCKTALDTGHTNAAKQQGEYARNYIENARNAEW